MALGEVEAGASEHRPIRPHGLIGERAGERRWERRYAGALALADAAGGIAALVVAEVARFSSVSQGLTVGGRRISYLALALLGGLCWVAMMAASGVYGVASLGTGNDEYRRLVEGAIRFLAVVALLSFALAASLARSVVFISAPLALALSAGAHHGGRRWLLQARQQGRCCRKVVAVGPGPATAALAAHLARAPGAGLRVVARHSAGEQMAPTTDEALPLLRTRDELLGAVAAGDADAVAVVSPDHLGPGGLQHLGWDLEGLGCQLLVAPGATDVAGPRLGVHPVAGLPLVRVAEARLSGLGRVMKDGVERVLAAFALVVVAPLLVGVSLAIKATSKGPVLFRQVRVGRHGLRFTMVKFRTMVEGAEAEQERLAHLNEAQGPLFKIRTDPRITPLGRWLRRYSIDELPQLWHVVRGQMSVVGPRPPLPSEVARFEEDLYRRFLVKPGLTGLWQINGRSELTWEDGVRLDLHYVDNWSLTLDLVIVLRTLSAVIKGRGAY